MTHQALTTYRALLDAAAVAPGKREDNPECLPARIVIPTGDRSSITVCNTRERLQDLAEHVRKHWTLYGGGPKPDDLKPKPRKASAWPAGLVRCWLGQIEDKDHAGAMLTAEQIGGWYALVGNTPDSHARGFVAPQQVEGLPERIVSACRDDGRWVVMDRVSGLSLCNQKARSRAAAEADALDRTRETAQRRGITPEALLSDALARVQPAADGLDQWRERWGLVEAAPVAEVAHPVPELAPEVAPVAEVAPVLDQVQPVPEVAPTLDQVQPAPVVAVVADPAPVVDRPLTEAWRRLQEAYGEADPRTMAARKEARAETWTSLDGSAVRYMMRRDGHTIRSLAQSMGITQKRVRHVREHGVQGRAYVLDWLQALAGTPWAPVADQVQPVPEVAPVSEVAQPVPEPAPEVHQAEPVQVQAQAPKPAPEVHQAEPVQAQAQHQAPEPADLPALRAVVQHHADQYHAHGRAEIADAAFDALMARLRTGEVQAGQPVPPDSPTRTVGARPVSGLPKVAHLVRMLSLTSTAAPDGLAQWDAALRAELAELGHPQPGPVAYACEPKIDGVALVARYEAGRLVRLATRGNGKQGEDVTRAARLVQDLPDRLDTQHPPDVLDVVGEVFMMRTDWRALNDHRALHGAQPYQDARGAVVAALQRKPGPGPADDAGPLRLRFAAHGVGLVEGWPGRPDMHSQTMDELQRMGLPVCPLRQLVHGPEGLQAYRARAAAWRDAAPFDTDGLVFKVDSRGLQARLGFDGRAPRWALADKSPSPATDYPINPHGFSVALTQRLRPIQARAMRTRRADIRTRRAPMRTRWQPLQPVQARAPLPCPGPAGPPSGRAEGPAPRGQAPPLGVAASAAPSPGCRGQCGTLPRVSRPVCTGCGTPPLGVAASADGLMPAGHWPDIPSAARHFPELSPRFPRRCPTFRSSPHDQHRQAFHRSPARPCP
jgi:hypothetical protein